MTTINPNDFVRVRLTDHGKRLLVASVDRMNDELRKQSPNAVYRAKVPEWDRDGWIQTQFHSIMDDLGNCWFAGSQIPFTELEKCEERRKGIEGLSDAELLARSQSLCDHSTWLQIKPAVCSKCGKVMGK